MSFYAFDFNSPAPGAPSPISLNFSSNAFNSDHAHSSQGPNQSGSTHDFHQYFDPRVITSSKGHKRNTSTGTEVDYHGQPVSSTAYHNPSFSAWIDSTKAVSPTTLNFALQPLPTHPTLVAATGPGIFPVNGPYLASGAQLDMPIISMSAIPGHLNKGIALSRTPSDNAFMNIHSSLLNGLQRNGSVRQALPEHHSNTTTTGATQFGSGLSNVLHTEIVPNSQLSRSVSEVEWNNFYDAFDEEDDEEIPFSCKELAFAAEYGVEVFDWNDMPRSRPTLGRDPSSCSVEQELDRDDESDVETPEESEHDVSSPRPSVSSPSGSASSQQTVIYPHSPRRHEHPLIHEKRKLSEMLHDVDAASDGDTEVDEPSASQSSPKKKRTSSQVYDPKTQSARVMCQWTDPLKGTRCGCGFLSSSSLRAHIEQTHVVREIEYFQQQLIPITKATALILITFSRIIRSTPARRTQRWISLKNEAIQVKQSIMNMSLDQAEWDSGKYEVFLKEMSKTVVIMATPLTCLSCGKNFDKGRRARTEFNKHVAGCNDTSSPRKSGFRKEKEYRDVTSDAKRLRWHESQLVLEH